MKILIYRYILFAIMDGCLALYTILHIICCPTDNVVLWMAAFCVFIDLCLGQVTRFVKARAK